ncbi:sigma-70 family RNA polymerase sigma factor [Limnoglobus roseus]|uniref:RNA polymerase sigma-70 region 2 domain-containing protein n=1 Tax=Limnoglobus roseus TaxID=2598579 RepID=A0A5C1AKY4_9BACT|nr:sigma-70 family RNA polymerase sigma factor [Limnoglobus roseus]QEL17558.1 hypothetical protein PX52LOC_04552 [Limnoglobus roseus]
MQTTLTPPQLAERVYPLVRQFMFRRAPAALADDLSQEAVLTIMRYSHRYDAGKGAPTTWAVMVCRSVLSKSHRRRGTKTFGELVGDDGREFDPVDHRHDGGETGPSPAERNRLRELMARLDPADREFVHARFVLELSAVEIAAQKLMTAGQVAWRVGRIIRTARGLA